MDAQQRKQEQRSYLLGLIFSIMLTLAAFGLVWSGDMTGGVRIITLAALALVQMAVQLRFFLHIDLKKSHRDDLQLILFTMLILSLMVGGTLLILTNQHMRM
jgi:cytochrome o ubiquinol oxidase operon protein cyoD